MISPRFTMAKDRAHFLELCSKANLTAAHAGLVDTPVEDYVGRRLAAVWMQTEDVVFHNPHATRLAKIRERHARGEQKIFIDRKIPVC